MDSWTDRSASFFSRRPFLLFVTLYAVLAVLAVLAHRYLPDVFLRAIASLTNGAGLGAFDAGAFVRSTPVPPGVIPDAPMWAIAIVAMVSGGLLALPVAWLYTLTRQKRGYNQSVVQSLILLPVVVAGVVVLVKFSLALAFSLAGIVAAVRFRNTLEDSKDAVYIFVVTGIGLAAGVELTAAAALSVVFNVATLLLFRSDFGRTPARLEGEMAEEAMQRALEMANRTSQFVARIDAEILDNMAPEQLEAVADRAWRKRRGAATGERRGGGEVALESTLVVRTGGAHAAREIVEAALGRSAKRWQFVSMADSDTGQHLTYALKLRKSVQPTAFLDSLKVEGANYILEAELK